MGDEQTEQGQKADQEPGAAAANVVASEQLLQGERMLVIRHAGEDYRLIVTRNNRLLLQK